MKIFGDAECWKLISKASSKSQGWMKSTKAMEVVNAGVLVQVTTQQKNPDGSYAVAEAIHFIYDAHVVEWCRDSGEIFKRAILPGQKISKETEKCS